MGGFLDFIRTSFLHVAPILVAAAIAVAIIVERTRALFSVYPIKHPREFYDKLSDLIVAGKTAEGIALCDRYQQKPVAQVMKQALFRAHQPETLIEHGLQIAVGEATRPIQRELASLPRSQTSRLFLGCLVPLPDSLPPSKRWDTRILNKKQPSRGRYFSSDERHDAWTGCRHSMYGCI